MNTPPQDVLHAIDRLNANSDFTRLAAWLDGQREEAVQDLLAQNIEMRVMQEQGYARCLHDILRTFRSARAALERHI